MACGEKSPDMSQIGDEERRLLLSEEFRRIVEEEVIKADYEGRLISTWRNFVVFGNCGHIIIMDEDRNRLFFVAHKIDEAVDFLLNSRDIKILWMRHEGNYEIIDDIDRFIVRIFDDEIDGEVKEFKTEEEALNFIKEREMRVHGCFDVKKEEEEVDIP